MMIDILFSIVHFCASCAPAANALSSSGGLLGGAAGAAAGVGGGPGGDGDLNYSPSDTNTGLPPEDVSSPMNTSPMDTPIQQDDDGNALVTGLVGLPAAAAEGAYTITSSGYKALNAIGEDILTQAKSDLTDDYLNRTFPKGDTPPTDYPGDYRMGKSIGNKDGSILLPNGDVLNPDGSITGTNGVTTTPSGYTKNPDGTVSPPADQSPAFNPDGSYSGTTDPGDLPPVP